jgi:hypothetical protein
MHDGTESSELLDCRISVHASEIYQMQIIFERIVSLKGSDIQARYGTHRISYMLIEHAFLIK